MENKSKLKKRIAIFAFLSFIAGFIFSDKNLTGNSVFLNKANPNGTFHFIGINLLMCSLLLAYYLFKNNQ